MHSQLHQKSDTSMAAFSPLPPVPPAAGGFSLPPYLIQLDLELASTLHRSGKGVQILAPERKELLDAQAAERVVTGVADAVLLAHVHHLVVHVEGVLQREGETQSCRQTPGKSDSI